jgi:inosine/xanthosine triphosphate pyrophosphatase family protein
MNPNENGKGPYETYTDVASTNIDKTAECKHNRGVSFKFYTQQYLYVNTDPEDDGNAFIRNVNYLRRVTT